MHLREKITIYALKSTLLIGLCLLFGVFFTAQNAFAQEYKLDGWAWSSNIGWISFNCENTSTCSTSDYEVKVDASDNLDGWAWSSNIGWIKFGGLNNFPASGGNARFTGSGIDGWARAYRAIDIGGQTLGSWDGWISLSGTATDNSPYGVSAGAQTNGITNLGGFAWGSSVIGWVDFSGVSIVDDSAFDYVLNAPRVVVDVGNSESRDIDVAKTNISATTEEVDLANSFSAITPSGSGLSFSFDGGTSCTPNSVCDIDFTVDATNASVGTYTVSIEGQSAVSNLRRTGNFIVEVRNGNTNTGNITVTCDVSPNPGFVNQPVTLEATIVTTATGPYNYTWSGSEGLNITGSVSGKTIQEEVIYRTIGLKTAEIDVEGSKAACGTGLNEPGFRVIVDPNFEEI